MVAAARQRCSSQLIDFMAAGGRFDKGLLVWQGRRLGGPNLDLRALPLMVSMSSAGIDIAADTSGWRVQIPDGPVFHFENADLYAGLGVLTERFINNELEGFKVDGAVVLDIGAHFGDSSVWFASHGARRVFAFEPFPQTAAVATESIRLNNLENVVVLEIAGVGAQSSRIRLRYDRTMSVIQSARLGKDAQGAGELTEVNVIPFAEAVSKAARQGKTSRVAVKIDCEGCEEDIFSVEDSWTALQNVQRLTIEWHREESLEEFLQHLRARQFSVSSRTTSDGTYIVMAERTEK